MWHYGVYIFIFCFLAFYQKVYFLRNCVSKVFGVTMDDGTKVKITFNLPNKEGPVVFAHQAETAFSVNDISQAAKEANTVFSFSGRHDGGDLCLLKTDSPYVDLLGAIKEAKQSCDSFLTTEIGIHNALEEAQNGDEMTIDNQEENCSIIERKRKIDTTAAARSSSSTGGSSADA